MVAGCSNLHERGGNVCVLRRYDQGISAIPERDTQAARIHGDFSGRTSRYSGVQGWVSVGLLPADARVA